MLQKLISIETARLVKNHMLRVELALLAAAVTGLFVLMFLAGQILPEEGDPAAAALAWPGGLEQALNMASAGGLGGVLIIVLAAALMTQSYQWRTLHFWLGRGAPRGAFLLARFLSLGLPALLFALVSLAAGGAASLLLTLLAGGSAAAGPDLAQAGLALLRTAYTLLPYAGLALLLGVATRSTAAAVGLGLGWILLLERVLAQVLAWIGGTAGAAAALLPSSLSAALMRANAAIVPGAAGLPAPAGSLPPLLAAALLGLYAALFLGAAVALLKKQDITG